ncbi:MAG TPA: NBR1-Ig-like domain-containing protein [Anaerolineae bacterium]|nr:NBR1-Ig-like domain-containing protein [Anaerolineae bacterium]
MKQRRLFLVAIVMLVVVSLACSLGGGDTTQPTAIPQQPQGTPPGQVTLPPIAQVTLPPVVEQPTITPLGPTQAPPPTPTETPPSGTGPGGCVLSAAFVADLTIPDNTIEAPNASFIKTWRIKNNGTCTWDPSYQLVFAEGNQMNGPAGVPINNTLPGANLDVSVNLKAPSLPSGTPYIGKWRLKASNAVIFGGFTVVIIVPLPPTATPTATPTTAPTGAWSGHWETNCGTYGCGVMDLVQTGGTVAGTYAGSSATGTINGTVNGNHLKGTWSISGSNGKIDWWLGSGLVKWRGNWDGVNDWCGHRTGETDPAPCGVGTFDGNWTVVCEGCDGAMHIDQDGKNFTGTYVNGTIDGTIDGDIADGQWHSAGFSGLIKWNLLSYNQFNGHYFGLTPGTFKWCGYRGGATEPVPCDAP